MNRIVGLVGKSAVAVVLAAGISRAQAPSTPQSGTPNSGPADCAELPVLTERLGRADKILHDWPNLARYAEANAALVAPAKFDARVVFMGDSITDAWISPEYGGFFPGKPYIDRGISGQTTPQMLLRFRADVIALQPKVVVILAGTNDIAGNTGPITLEETEGNIGSMAEPARATGIRVVLSSVLPVSNYGHDRDGNPLDVRIKRPPEKILGLN